MGSQINTSRLICLSSITLLLSGCISLTPPKATQQHFVVLSGSARQQRLARLQKWSIEGAFSVQQVSKKPVLANYTWQQQGPHHYRIRISSALNLFTLTLLGRRHQVSLWRAQGQPPVVEKTPEGLLQKEMGWSLPIRDLYYWVRGMVAPGPSQASRDTYGHLNRLRQQGWSIQFSHYVTVNGIDLPGKLVMKRSGIQSVIVMKQWILNK